MRKVRDNNNVTVDILFNSAHLLVLIKVPVKWVEDDEPRLDSTTRVYIRNALKYPTLSTKHNFPY